MKHSKFQYNYNNNNNNNNNNNVWMTDKLVHDWLLCPTRKMGRHNQNALLLMDKIAAHNCEGLNMKHIEVPVCISKYKLPTTTGSRHRLKHSYRKRSDLSHYLIGETTKGIYSFLVRLFFMQRGLR
jgi:hypothetical protein